MNKLENKIKDAIETIESYEKEIDDLKTKNRDLENQHLAWESKLNSLITRFENIGENEVDQTFEDSKPLGNESDEQNFEISNEAASIDSSNNDDNEKNDVFNTSTSIGNQAVASSPYYSNYEE